MKDAFPYGVDATGSGAEYGEYADEVFEAATVGAADGAYCEGW